ncbi:MAG: DUF6359 domain-containing protein [Alloprevotella sp.]|nr:DUF6359 domain-containing protein [Alloprevotella sp.]
MTRYAFLLCGLLCLLLSGLSACGKIELPETDSGQNTKPPQGGDQSGDQSGGDNGQGTETQGDTMSVAAMLSRASVDDWVRVKGYIVGYVAGTTLSKARFECPPSAPNTNMLIADTPAETDVARCIPILLDAKDGSREELNLYDNPELLGCAIVIEGAVATYFGTKGIKKMEYYSLLDGNDTPDNPDNPDKPDNPDDPDDPDTLPDLPIIDDNPDVIDGRSPRLDR